MSVTEAKIIMKIWITAEYFLKLLLARYQDIIRATELTEMKILILYTKLEVISHFVMAIAGKRTLVKPTNGKNITIPAKAKTPRKSPYMVAPCELIMHI